MIEYEAVKMVLIVGALLVVAIGVAGVVIIASHKVSHTPPCRKDAVHHAAGSNADSMTILNLLGVPSERVRKAVITIDVGCALMVEVETYTDEPSDDGEPVVVLKNYELVAVDGVVTMLGWFRRLTQCSRGIHWRVKYDSGMDDEIGRAGTCSDCGERIEAIVWPTAPMPRCKLVAVDGGGE